VARPLRSGVGMAEGDLYFAYGSNLCRERLLERVGAAQVLGPARAPGRRLVFDKHGRDGSGKANLVVSPGEVTWGVVYRLAPEGFERLDRYEGGYRRISMEVLDAGDRWIFTQTYVSARRTDDPTPFASYKDLILEGARSHGLPAGWLETLARLPARPDPPRAGS